MPSTTGSRSRGRPTGGRRSSRARARRGARAGSRTSARRSSSPAGRRPAAARGGHAARRIASRAPREPHRGAHQPGRPAPRWGGGRAAAGRSRPMPIRWSARTEPPSATATAAASGPWRTTRARARRRRAARLEPERRGGGRPPVRQQRADAHREALAAAGGGGHRAGGLVGLEDLGAATRGQAWRRARQAPSPAGPARGSSASHSASASAGGVAARHEQAVGPVGDDVAVAGDVGRHHGRAGRERLREHHAEGSPPSDGAHSSSA